MGHENQFMVFSWPAITKYKFMVFSWAMIYFMVSNSAFFIIYLKNLKTLNTISRFIYDLNKTHELKIVNASFMGPENQFMVFS